MKSNKIPIFIAVLIMVFGLTACSNGSNSDSVPRDEAAETGEPGEHIQEEHIPGEHIQEERAQEEDTEDAFNGEEVESAEDFAEPDKGTGMDNAGAWTLQEARSLAFSNGDLCAAVFLGYGTDIASFLEEADLTDYPFVMEIPEENYVEMSDEGTEIYGIIPTDPCASLSVNEWIVDETNGFYGETGQVFYRSESGEAILLRANPSDAVPSTQVVIVDRTGEMLDFNPALSLYDGKMTIPWHSPGVTDITDYER